MMIGDSQLMQQVKRIPHIVWLVAVFVVLAIFYSLIIPIFEGPDEDDHFRYVKSIADHRALPVQLFEPGGGQAGHQGWQPPLYYSIAAILIAPIDTSDFSQHLWRNEYVTFVGDPACCGRNIYYHTDSENYPYTCTTLAVHLARLLSVLFGAITVAATYAIARAIHESRVLALAAASVVAFNPSFLFASALVSNDTALAAFASLVLLVWIKLIYGALPLDLKSGVILGVLIGLALLTKTTALGLIPLTVLVFTILAWRQRNLREFLFAVFAFFASFAILTFCWFVRNQILYGDPLATRLVSVSALFPRTGDLTLAELVQISLPQIWTTFWGGPTPSDFSPLVLFVLALSIVLAGLGSIVFAIRNSQFAVRASLFFLFIWLGLLFIAMIQFIRTTQGGDQGRYLFPAISVFALFFVFGITTFVRWMTRDKGQKDLVIRLSSSAIGLVFFGLALFVPFAYTLPAYARPALLSQQDLARFSSAAPTNFANQIELLGYELDARSRKPGEVLRVTLYWRALAPMQESYRVFVHLVGQKDTSAGGVDVIPVRGAFPTVYWKPGDALRENYNLPVADNALPGKYSLEVGLYPVGKPGERLTAVGSGDDRVLLTAIKIAPREPVAYAPSTRANAIFADQIELMGYDAGVESNRVRLVLYWRAKKPMDRDYTIFVHALDASGKIIAQIDRQPQAGNYPTSLWDTGEQVRDEFLFDLSAGAHRLAVGLYRADTNERLQVTTLSGSTDHLEFALGTTP